MREEEKDSGASRKLLDLMGEIEELRSSIVKKNIIIEKIKYHEVDS
jgi:hypothetical protein